jgi:hypothetical protein
MTVRLGLVTTITTLVLGGARPVLARAEAPEPPGPGNQVYTLNMLWNATTHTP